MIAKLVVFFCCVAVLVLSVLSRLRRRDVKEMESAGQFGEMIVIGGVALAGFLALWDTAMARGGLWWAIFVPYLILGGVAAFKAKRRLEALVQSSRTQPKS